MIPVLNRNKERFLKLSSESLFYAPSFLQTSCHEMAGDKWDKKVHSILKKQFESKLYSRIAWKNLDIQYYFVLEFIYSEKDKKFDFSR